MVLILFLAMVVTAMVRGAGLSMVYLMAESFLAASELSVGGWYRGAIVVGIVKRTAFSSAGSSQTYLIVTLAELPGFRCPIWNSKKNSC